MFLRNGGTTDELYYSGIRQETDKTTRSKYSNKDRCL